MYNNDIISDGIWGGLSFALEPVDTVVRKKGPAWLHCVANGYPEPTLTWRRDNSPVDTSGDTRRYDPLNCIDCTILSGDLNLEYNLCNLT